MSAREGDAAVANKALLGRYVDAYNRAAEAELDGLVTPGYVHHSNGDALNLAQFKAGARWLRAGLADFRVEVVELIGEGDRVAARWVARGTQCASMFGEPVASTAVVIHGTTVYRFEGERIAEDWEVFDEADLRRQVGALS